MICNLCQKEFSKFGIKGHIWRVHGEGILHKPRIGAKAWNHGLSKETDERVKKYSMHPNAGKGKTSPEVEKIRRAKLSIIAKKNNLGGHTSKQKLWFKKNDGSEVFLQSSYEVIFATILEELKVDWVRPNPLEWVDQVGISHKYYPDFLINDCIYIDTKNDYLVKKDQEKISRVIDQNKIVLHVVTKQFLTKDFVMTIAGIA